jgi:capsular polysaccharide biosynthesis protein
MDNIGMTVSNLKVTGTQLCDDSNSIILSCPPPISEPWKYFKKGTTDSMIDRYSYIWNNSYVEGNKSIIYNTTHYQQTYGCKHDEGIFISDSNGFNTIKPLGIINPNFKHTLVLDKIIVFSQYWGETYYHFLLEVIPRIFDIPYDIFNDPTWKFVITSPMFGDVAYEYLSLIGIPLTRIISISTTDIIKANRILHISHTNCWAPQPSRLLQIQSIFVKDSTLVRDIGIVIYRSHNRGIINHNELINSLKHTYVNIHWIEFIGTETANRTIDTWSRARYVVGPHGAGFSNLIFCKPGTKIIEIIPSKWLHVMYGPIASILGHKWIGMIVPSYDNYNMIAPVADIINSLKHDL